MQLRDYQQDAVDSLYNFMRSYPDQNPCIVLPTGAGKTPVLATIAHDCVTKWNGRIAILAHVKELLQQTRDTICEWYPDLADKVGVNSAGLGQRDMDHPIIIGGIQSVYKSAPDLDSFNLILIDEAHLIPTDGDGMYRRFIEEAKVVNPNVKVVGLTATDYRMGSGRICQPDNILNVVCYEISVRELIERGFLSPLRSSQGIDKDFTKLPVARGEFVQADLESEMMKIVMETCEHLYENTFDRKSVLIFATGVLHAELIASTLKSCCGVECKVITGDTPKEERADVIEAFKAGELRYLVNVNVLTTGFDATNVDCVALLRPTLSPGLYYQMVGRGFRLHEGKTECLVLDYGGNIERHGPVDAIDIKDKPGQGGEAVVKLCPDCKTYVPGGSSTCPYCGHEFPPREATTHDTKSSNAAVTTLEDKTVRETFAVKDVRYFPHTKRDSTPDTPKTLRVEYQLGVDWIVREWVCIEHTGYAGDKARAWWEQHTHAPFPSSAFEASEVCNSGVVGCPDEITVEDKMDGSLPQIVDRSPVVKPDLDKPLFTPIAEEELPF